MISGFNTSVDFEGNEFHVQTEDLGPELGAFETTVFERGAVVAVKRSRYESAWVSEQGLDALAETIERQHRTVCAAILKGRLGELVRLHRDAMLGEAESSAPLDNVRDAPAGPITIEIANGTMFCSGESKDIEVSVRRSDGTGAHNVSVSIKLIGTEFRATIYHARTDKFGVAYFSLRIPRFSGGRAAAIITATEDSYVAELRKVLKPERAFS